MSKITASTQEHLDILEIRDGLVVLKNGSVSAVIETTAVNFDLLSEIEQDAIIAAFSMLLNSITFPIQIVLRSKKLDISKYLEKIHRVEEKIDNINNRLDGVEVNTNMMGNHIHFVEDVYERVKKPLNYITTRINNMIT